jgi:phosphatidylinositol kinase/protein kinase (PI-3  family)
VEALISLNNHLSQPNAAIGILHYAQTHHNVRLKESWYEKLQNWEEALSAYEAKQKVRRFVVDALPVIKGKPGNGTYYGSSQMFVCVRRVE